MPNVDRWANIASIQCVESAANTLTFKKLETGINLFEKRAWVIGRLAFFIGGVSATQFNATGDYLQISLTVSNNMTAICDFSNPSEIDFMLIGREDIGTAATGMFLENPRIRDWWGLPGGGLIVPPNPLYLAVKGTGLVAAATVTVRMFYTTIELKPDEYWELVEARRIISS